VEVSAGVSVVICLVLHTAASISLFSLFTVPLMLLQPRVAVSSQLFIITWFNIFFSRLRCFDARSLTIISLSLAFLTINIRHIIFHAPPDAEAIIFRCRQPV